MHKKHNLFASVHTGAQTDIFNSDVSDGSPAGDAGRVDLLLNNRLTAYDFSEIVSVFV